MKLLDVNVLVYAHREDAERHDAFRAWLEAALDSDAGCAVSELVLSGCLRILTHPRIFSPPTPLDVAVRFVDELHEHPNVTVLAPGPGHWEIFLRLCRSGDARGNLISDAYHAALAMETGCEWATTDRDFARFDGLRWQNPLSD